MKGIFCALDRQNLSDTLALVHQLQGLPLHFKLGLEFFTAAGLEGVQAVRAAAPGAKIFLDLKLHDIPNTVAGAVRAALICQPDFLTLHASGGQAMMRAAADVVRDAGADTKLLGVTVLTHLDDGDLLAVGQTGPVAAQVLRLAQHAKDAGMAGVVASPWEVAYLRQALGPKMLFVVPGIRPAGAAAGDQKRVMTPAQAASAGADYLVIGRPVTMAPDAMTAAAEILAELPSAQVA